MGIGTVNPNAILDIRSSNQRSPDVKDGILIPKIDDFPSITPGANQDGMLVFVTGNNGTPKKGFYYWNNSIPNWVPFIEIEKIDDLVDGRTDASGSSTFLGLNSGINDDGTTNANIGIGYNSLNSTNTGNLNVAIGYSAMLVNTQGSSNTSIGAYSMDSNNSGNFNSAYGRAALNANVSGDNNTAIGYNSGQNSIGSGNIFIGSHSGTGEIGDNKLYIENSTSNIPLIGAVFSLNRVGINRSITDLTNTFEVNGTASKASAGDWLTNSDARLKKDIRPISGNNAIDRLLALKGVSYFWDDSSTGITRLIAIQYGFVAQEVMKVFPEHVSKDKLGYFQTSYGTYDAFYIEAIGELKNRLDEKKIRR